MAVTSQMRTSVAQLYVSLFGRAPEASGLGYWAQQLGNGVSLQQIAQDMFNVAPSRAYYPSFLTNEEIITKFYVNVLGRNPDAGGLAYWTGRLNTLSSTGTTAQKALAQGSVIVEMLTAVVGYSGTDAAGLQSQSLFNNKVAVALKYAVEMNGDSIPDASTLIPLVTAGANGQDAANAQITKIFNKAPAFAAASVAASALEDAAVTGKVTATDSDAGDVLTYKLGTGPANGKVTVAADGSYSYVGNQDFNGADSFTVVVTDKSGATATQTVNVAVAAVNDAPTFAGATAAISATEDTPINGKVTATDVDAGDALTYKLGTAAANGKVTVAADGTYTYVGNQDFNGADSFTVIVTDKAGATSTQTVNVSVAAVNDAPVFGAASITVAAQEDLVFSGKLAATDVDVTLNGDALTYSLGSQASKGVVTVGADGSYTYKGNQDFNGSDSFTVVVRDKAGAASTQTVFVNVAAVNDTPVFATAAVAAAGNEDTAITGVIVATDVDVATNADGLTYSLGTAPANGTVTVGADGFFSYQGNQDFNGADSFTVKVTDKSGAVSSQTVNVTVAAVNDAPVVSSGATATIAENAATSTVLYTATSTDVDAGDTVAYSLKASGDAAMLNIDAATGVVTLKASANFEAKSSYSFTVVATDKAGATAEKTVTAAVTDVNEAPVVTSGATATIAENAATSTVLYTATGSDVDAGDTRTFSLKAGEDSAMLNIDPATGVVTLKASADLETKSSYNFTVVVTDKAGLTAEKAVVANVTNVNEAPVVTSAATATIAENAATSTVLYTATATDVDAGDTRVYSLKATGDAAMLDINPATGAVTLKASANFEAKASYSFTVVATDAGGLTAEKEVVATVTNVNEAPVITSSATATAIAENGTAGAVVYTAVATDVDAGTTLTYSLSGADASAFSINSSTGVVTINNANNFEAKSSYSFNVVATDNGGLTATQAVTLATTNVNEAPVAVGDTATTPDNTAVTINVLANDSDVDAGDVLSINSVSQGANGSVVISGTSVVYTPNPTFLNGTDTFTYVTKDAAGLVSSPVTVTVTVNTVNSKPVIAASQVMSVNENDNTAGKSVGFVSASDQEGNGIGNWVIVGGNAAGNFTINNFTGEITRSATANFDAETTGSYSLQIQAQDTSGLKSDVQTVTVNVANLNDVAPVVVANATFNVAENGTAVTTVSATDGDAVASPITYTLGGADAAKFAISNAGVLTFVAAPNFEAPGSAGASNVYNLTVTANDGANNSTPKAITVTVTDVNDVAPVITSGAAANFAENTSAATVVYTATSSDADTTGETRTYTLGGADAALFNINSATGAITFKTSPNFEAPADAGANNVYDVTVTATDGVNTSTSQAVAITVTNVNETPISVNDAATVLSGQTANVTVLANDSDTDGAFTGTVTAVTQPAQGGLVEIAGDGKSVNFTSTPGYAGTSTFTYTITDAGGLTSTASVTMTVNTQLGGTSGADNLIGASATAETLEGGAGNDTIDGGGAADKLDGGADNDRVTARGGETAITGGDGIDTLVVASTFNTLVGVDLSNGNQQAFSKLTNAGAFTPATDTATTTTITSFENLDASAVSFNLVARDTAGTTSIKTGTGVDTILIANATGAVTVDAGKGNDTITVSSANGNTITINAGEGNDTVAGNNQKLVANLGDGTNTITAVGAGSTVTGGSGVDTITAGGAAVSIVGGAGADVINLNSGANTVTAGTGADVITAGTGNDHLSGEDDNDTFTMAGNYTSLDTIAGGSGTDIITVSASIADAVFTSTTTVETLTVSGASGATLGSLAAAAGIVTLNETGGTNQTFTLGAGYTNNATVNLNTSGDTDTVAAAAYTKDLTVATTAVAGLGTTNVVTGGTGTNDQIVYNTTAGAVTQAANANITAVEKMTTSGVTTNNVSITLDNANVAATKTLTIDGSALTTGVLTVVATAEADGKVVVLGGAANDLITASASTLGDHLTGNAGDDTFTMAGNLTSLDTVAGGSGTDIITTTAANVDVDFTNVSGVETLNNLAAVNVTFGSLAAAAGIVTLNETAASNQTFTLGAGFTNNVTVNLNTSGDTDTVSAAAYTKDLTIATTAVAGLGTTNVVTGGTGTNDQIVYNTTAGAVTQAANANITAVEKMTTSGATTNNVSITLDNANVAATKTLTIDGSALTTGVLTVVATAEADGKVVVIGGAANDLITASASTLGDNLSGGNGNDTFTMAGNLTSLDTVAGGSGTDIITTTAANVDVDFTNVSGVETLNNLAAVNVTLGSLAAAAGIVTLNETAASNQTFTLGAGFTNNVTVNLNTSGDTDTVSAAAYTKDLTIATTATAGLGANNVVTGGTGTNDQIVYNTTAGAVTQAANANITAVEKMTTSGVTTNNVSITLADANVAATKTLTIDGSALTTGVLTVVATAEADGKVVVLGGAANDLITASASTLGDNLSGNAGNDTFTFAGNLTSLDTVAGGSGTDTINVTSLTVTDVMFTAVTTTENLTLSAAGAMSVTLGTKAQAAGITTVDVSASGNNAVTVDLTGMTSTTAGVTVTTGANTAVQTILGSSAADTITLVAGGTGANLVVGGAGGDTIALGGSTVGNVRVNLNADVATGTTLANADKISGFTSGDDKLNITGATFMSPGGNVLPLTVNTDDLGSTTAARFVSTTAANLANLGLAGNQPGLVFQVTGDNSVALFTTQAGIDEAVTFITTNIGTTTVANTNVLIVLNDGTNTAVFQYQEGALDAGIQASELTLVGVLTGITTLAAGDII